MYGRTDSRTYSREAKTAGNRSQRGSSRGCGGKTHRRIDPQKVLMLVILSAAVFAAGFGVCSVAMPSGTAMVEANEQLSDVKYKVVEIRQGDTLWSIAQENMSPGYSDIYEYIAEIKTCNQLQCNNIRSGNYLMLPYYETIS